MPDKPEESKNQQNSQNLIKSNHQTLLLIVAIIGLFFSGWQLVILNNQLSEQIKMNSPLINFGLPICPEVLISTPSINNQTYNFTIRNDGNSPLLFNISTNPSNRIKLKNINFLYAKIEIENPRYNPYEFLINEIRHSVILNLIQGRQPLTETFNATLTLSIPAKEERTFQYSIEIPTNESIVKYQIKVFDLSDTGAYLYGYTFNCSYILNKTENNSSIFI